MEEFNDITNKQLMILLGSSRTTIFRCKKNHPRKFLRFYKLYQRALSLGVTFEDILTKEDLSKDKIKAFFDKQGIRRVSKILGYDPASLWRFTDTQTHPIPQIIQVIVKIVNFIDRSQ